MNGTIDRGTRYVKLTNPALKPNIWEVACTDSHRDLRDVSSKSIVGYDLLTEDQMSSMSIYIGERIDDVNQKAAHPDHLEIPPDRTVIIPACLAEPVEVEKVYVLMLKRQVFRNPIAAIKIVRELLDCGLKEAKFLVDVVTERVQPLLPQYLMRSVVDEGLDPYRAAQFGIAQFPYLLGHTIAMVPIFVSLDKADLCRAAERLNNAHVAQGLDIIEWLREKKTV